jgi:hypothetical protein
MFHIEREVHKQNQYIEEQSRKMREIMHKKVSLKGLKEKIEVKYFQFFERKLLLKRR